MSGSRIQAKLRMADYKRGYKAARRTIIRALRKERSKPNWKDEYKRWLDQLIELVKNTDQP